MRSKKVVLFVILGILCLSSPSFSANDPILPGYKTNATLPEYNPGFTTPAVEIGDYYISPLVANFDFNGDIKFDISDVYALIRWSLGSKDYRQDMDLNGDGKIDFADAGLLNQVVKFKDLTYDKQIQILSLLNAKVATVVLRESVTPQKAAELLLAIDPNKAAAIIGSENMSPDIAAKIMGYMDTQKAAGLLVAIDPKQAAAIIASENMNKDTAVNLMLSLRDKNWQIFSQTFGFLCESNAALAAQILTDISPLVANFDFNGDIKFDISDVYALLKWSLGAKDYRQDMDLNGDGKIDFADAGLLNQVVKFKDLTYDKQNQILSRLNLDAATAVLRESVSPQKAAELLLAIDPKQATAIISSENMNPDTTAKILAYMDADKAAEFLLAKDWQKFSQTFGFLCEYNAALAAQILNNDFGISNESEKFFTIYVFLTRGGITSEQLGLLLSTKDENGTYLISTAKVADFFFYWSEADGGQRPWDKAITALVECGRLGEILKTLFNKYNFYYQPLKDQFFLSLLDVIQKQDNLKADALLNECIGQKIFSLDPKFDLTIMRAEDEWKQIALTSGSIYTKAAALSQIKDEVWLKDYVFNIEGEKGLVFSRDVSDTEFAAILRTGETSSWFSQLTNKDERKFYIQKVLAIDTTDFKPYINYTPPFNKCFVCVSFSIQLYMNGIGFTNPLFKGSYEDFEKSMYSIPQNPYGIPISLVGVNSVSKGLYHAINAVFIGDNINDSQQTRDWNNWLFIEPQGGIVSQGLWNMPTDSDVTVYLAIDWVSPWGGGNNETTVTFHINKDDSITVL